jgi:hypothetical protein
VRNLLEHPITEGEVLDFLLGELGEFAAGEIAAGDMGGCYLLWLIKRTVPPDGYWSERFGFYVTGTGQVLTQTHPEGRCYGENCVVHHPSQHALRGLRTHWRGDRSLMERVCPHGVGHPDPDEINPDTVHGCCGCCQPPAA